MMLCIDCVSLGYCAKLNCILVGDQELNNLDFVEDVRSCARNLRVSPSEWRDFIYDMYRDYPGRVLGSGGKEVFLNLEVFETDGIREWFRDWIFRAGPLCRSKRLRSESRERVRAIATLLRAQNPGVAVMWGVRSANENRAPVSD